MSELYLVLRRRLEEVTDWVALETATLKNARKSLGLSYEAMGRKLNVAAKTWERWEKAGRIPRWELARVAEILELEIERPARQRVEVLEESPDAATRDEELHALREELAEVRGMVAQLLDQQQPAQPARKARRRSA